MSVRIWENHPPSKSFESFEIKMKPSALVLLALLGLASARPKQSSQNSNVSLLNPESQGMVPPSEPGPLTTPLPEYEDQPAQEINRIKRSVFRENDKLSWQTFRGRLPRGAVNIIHSGRREYVCKHECHCGFYSPSLDHYCHVPLGGDEHREIHFEILVNENNFELLEWKEDHDGSVPPNSIQTCANTDIYVARNVYGLGKVHSQHHAIFVIEDGEEEDYDRYKVLTINRAYQNQKISNVRYIRNEAEITRLPPEEFQHITVTNNQCSMVRKKVKISKTTRVENTWHVTSKTNLQIISTIEATIPFVGSASVGFKAERTYQFDKGTTKVTSKTHTLTLAVNVPPNHSCTFHMDTRQTTIQIPYTANLIRTYNNGKTTSTYISGTYDGVKTENVRAEFQRCEPVANAEPCRAMSPLAYFDHTNRTHPEPDRSLFHARKLHPTRA